MASPLKLFGRLRSAFRWAPRTYGDIRENHSDIPTGLNRDHIDLLSQLDHRELIDACRYLYTRFPAINGAIEDKVNHVIGNGWGAQYDGANEDWGRKAENWLYDYSRICDARGQPYGLPMNMHTGGVALLRDGEFFIHKFKNPDGYPLQQWLEAHRIGARNGIELTYFDAKVRNGIAYNVYGRPIAYHFLGESEQDDQWILARDITHVFDPKWFSQGRGVSPLANALLDWLDVMDCRTNEKFAQRLFSALALKNKTETGLPTAHERHFGKTGTTKTAANGAKTEELVTTFERGGIRFLKIGGEELEAFNAQRPTLNQQAFEQSVLRGAFRGLNWSYEQAYDGSKLGGAGVRRDIASNQRSAERMQQVLYPAWYNLHGWAVACAIQLEILEPDVDWFRWTPQLPAKLTADAGRESAADIEEYKIGFQTLRKITAKAGDWWLDIREQREKEVDDLLTRARRIAKNHEMDVMAAANLIEQRSANPPAATPQPQESEEPK